MVVFTEQMSTKKKKSFFVFFGGEGNNSRGCKKIRRILRDVGFTILAPTNIVQIPNINLPAFSNMEDVENINFMGDIISDHPSHVALLAYRGQQKVYSNLL